MEYEQPDETFYNPYNHRIILINCVVKINKPNVIID